MGINCFTRSDTSHPKKKMWIGAGIIAVALMAWVVIVVGSSHGSEATPTHPLTGLPQEVEESHLTSMSEDSSANSSASQGRSTDDEEVASEPHDGGLTGSSDPNAAGNVTPPRSGSESTSEGGLPTTDGARIPAGNGSGNGEGGVGGVWHEPTYKTVHHEAVYRTIHHDAEYLPRTEYYTVCNDCGYKVQDSIYPHLDAVGHHGYSSDVPFTENVLVSGAWDEEVLVTPAFDEQVLVNEGYWS
jgi:hypothetical protein